jgi:SM-20-related protein
MNITSEHDQFESLVRQLLDRQYGIMDDFMMPMDYIQLRQHMMDYLERGEFKAAGIGQHAGFQQNTGIRNDRIRWIDEHTMLGGERDYLARIQRFMQFLNETCYTGLRSVECHYAVYGIGSFYKKHLDQFQSDSGRRYSIILYLNEQWTEADGGQLVLYKGDETITILPAGNRFVFFESDKLEHEVLPANRDRWSVTGWMRNK